MPDEFQDDNRFGEIAIRKQMISRDNLDRALVIQRCIFSRTKVQTPIGKVLLKMGLMTEVQVEIILTEQKSGGLIPSADQAPNQPNVPPQPLKFSDIFTLTVTADKLGASLAPTGMDHNGVTLGDIKRLLVEEGIAFGLVSDKLLSSYLEKNPLFSESFKVAAGIAPEPGHPPQIQYHFDTDPMRIGTLKADGTMDWKNRGDIPQVAVGDLLAEKVGGAPGRPGTNVYGEEVPPPKIKEPQLKSSKGAQRSEDGRQITAKISGTPKLETDGRIAVYSILPIESDIGLETGHIDFEGHIEVRGAVNAGYVVKGKSLSVNEIQNATITISEDVVSYGGIYGSSLKVGGNLKASHMHNCTIEVLGDLVVEREIFGCNIECNGQCSISGGKIIASKIGAKKGIQVKDVGTSAARPSELIVGVDHKFERDIKVLKEELAGLETQKTETENAIVRHKARVDELDVELGLVAQEQDGVMVQRRQLEDRLINPKATDNPEKQKFLSETISELGEKYNALDQRVQAIMGQDEQIRALIAGLGSTSKTIDDNSVKLKEDISILEEAAKVDPGIPVLKVSGTIYAKSLVVGPHKKIMIPQDMQQVRIAEIQEDPKQFLMKVTSLR